jgi:dolichol kinase
MYECDFFIYPLNSMSDWRLLNASVFALVIASLMMVLITNPKWRYLSAVLLGYTACMRLSQFGKYLLSFVSSSAVQKLIMYWIIVLVALLPIPYILKSIKSNKSIVTWRKYFHLVCVVLFSPSIGDPILVEFTAFAGLVVLLMFLNLELVRVSRVSPGITKALSTLMSPFLDSKDKDSKIVTSPIELLFACIFPFWLASYFGGIWSQTDLLLSGILTVGIGDSAAAVGGVRVTKPHRFPFSKSGKSIQGLLCFLMSTFSVLHLWGLISAPTIGACIVASITEAYVDKFDNIFAPIMYAIANITIRLALL